MKKTLFKIFSAASLLGIPMIFASVALASATAFYVTNLPTSHTSNSFSADYEVDTTAPQKVSFYAWIGEYTGSMSAWKKDILVGSMDPSTQVPHDFGATFDYSTYGIVPGKTYGYVIADRMVNEPSTEFFVTPGSSSYIKCFDVAGDAPCQVAQNGNQPVTPADLKVALVAREQSRSLGTPGNFIEVFDATPSGTLTANTDVTLKVYKNNSGTSTNAAAVATPTISFPRGSHDDVPTYVDGLKPGSYTAVVFSGTKIISDTVDFDIVDPAPGSTSPATPSTPAKPSTPAAPSSGTVLNATGGMKISFPPGKQSVKETSAEFNGIVKVSIDMPVNIGYVSGVAGSPLSNERTLLAVSNLAKGSEAPIKLSFSGLTAGTTYAFAFVNRESNQTSAPLRFTTPGGKTNEAAVFAGERVGGSEDPTGNITIDDTISDKGIVPKCGRTKGSPDVQDSELTMCGYKDFMQLISNVMQYMLIILGPVVAIFAMFAGFMIMILGRVKDPSKEIMDKLNGYKKLLLRAVVGVLIILLAWTLVATILNGLGVKPEYVLLDLFSGK